MWWDVLIGNLIFWPLYVWICMMPERIMEYALENFKDE
jgi:hypothetical protein